MSKRTRVLPELMVVIVAFGIAICLSARFDFESGSHRITPTAMDTDFWGNYRVYYKTSDFTKSSEEDFYYIENDNDDLAAQVRDAIVRSATIVVHYEKYIGLKGVAAPKTAPITKVDVLE